MRVIRLAAGAVLAVFASLALLPSSGSGQAQIKVPPDFTFPRGKDSPGVVTFSHEFHETKVDKCAACHTKVFKMKKGTSGTLNMAKIKAGEQCGTCHNGKTEVGGTVVFLADDKANCERCHKK